MIPALPHPVAVACNDAGAANIVLAWLARHSGEVRAVMAGPAERLWRARFGDRPLAPSIEVALDGAAAMLTGTGWASDLEHQARIVAHVRNVRSIAVLDHWVNYRDRFIRNGETMLPDVLWATDPYAEAEARRCFPTTPIERYDNLYEQEEVARVAPLPGQDSILYVLEPARSCWGRTRAGEFQALDYFLERRPFIGATPETPIVLRPHPSEARDKYDAWLGDTISLDDSPSVGIAIGRARRVAGLGSAAMVVALHAGRSVICTRPPWAPPCPLPHPGIVQLWQA
jgi:hypothetical protein